MLIEAPGGMGRNSADGSSRKLFPLTLTSIQMNGIHEVNRDERGSDVSKFIVGSVFKNINGPGYIADVLGMVQLMDIV